MCCLEIYASHMDLNHSLKTSLAKIQVDVRNWNSQFHYFFKQDTLVPESARRDDMAQISQRFSSFFVPGPL